MEIKGISAGVQMKCEPQCKEFTSNLSVLPTMCNFCDSLLSALPSVQEDVEQGAVPFVRDESLREPSVRIHLHYLPR